MPSPSVLLRLYTAFQMTKCLTKELTAETETATKTHLGLFIRNHVRPERTYSVIKLLSKCLQKTWFRQRKRDLPSKGHGKDKPELDTGILHHDFCYSYEKAVIK